MESILQKAKAYATRSKLKNPGSPAELGQLRKEIISYLQVLGAEYDLGKTLEVLHMIGIYPTIACFKEGFSVTDKVDETDILENGATTAFAIIYPDTWHETPSGAIESYIQKLK